MVEIKYQPTISVDDVEEMTGIRWDYFYFTQGAGNDAYQVLDLEDWYIEELEEELKSEYIPYKNYHRDIANQLKLIHILRDEYKVKEDQVLIWVSW